jgi:adenylate cyclase
VEIERKWLVEALPDDLGDWPAQEIAQGYIAITPDAEVRLRAKGGQHLLTVKSSPALVRVEEELPIDAEVFERLWPLTAGRRLEKIRHAVRWAEVLLEVDVYEGDLAGLVVAEAEFPDEAASRAWEPPPWVGRELTGDRRWANQALAVDGCPPR